MFRRAQSARVPPTRGQNPFDDPAVRARPQSVQDVPPAYSPTAPRGEARVPAAQVQQISQQGESSAPPADVQRRSSVEDPLAALKRYDVVFLVDDSPSMVPLWNEARDALMGVVEKAAKYDKDGIDLFFMNAERALKDCVRTDEVAAVFRSVVPSGSTPTALRCDDLLRPYIEQCEDANAAKTALPKPLILVILTDGRADDEDMLKDIIVEFAQRLDDIRAPPSQLGIQLLQIGDDADAAEFLQSLDDSLKEEAGVRDIVDTRSFSGSMDPEQLLRILLGSVNRRIDAQA